MNHGSNTKASHGNTASALNRMIGRDHAINGGYTHHAEWNTNRDPDTQMVLVKKKR